MKRNSSLHPEPRESTEGLAKTFAASIAVLIAGLIAIGQATDLGHSFTTETLRREEVARKPRALPEFVLRDATDHDIPLQRLLASDGRVQIVDFVYTRCQTVCTSLGSTYQQLQRQLVESNLQDKVGLLSISFDPSGDDASALREYAARMRMQPHVWRIVTLASSADRQRLLDAFGIMVVPAARGEFEHNSALHIVAADGRLVRIVDDRSPDLAIDIASAWTRPAAR
ncbi:MAG: SCO family protein [Burkholderiaceae bacterium]